MNQNGNYFSNLRKDVEIDKTRLDEELSEQAAKYLFISEKAAVAEAKYAAFKAQAEAQIARLTGAIRQDLLDKGAKPTEKMIESETAKHPEYLKIQTALNQHRVERDVTKALREAWHMRKDCLIQLCIMQRAEMENIAGSVVKSRPSLAADDK